MKKKAGLFLLVFSLFCSLAAFLGLPLSKAVWFEASEIPVVFPMLTSTDGSVSVNSADAEELAMLPGIGETLAQAILDERESHGPFYYAEDLISVRGIGKSKLLQIRPFLNLSEGE